MSEQLKISVQGMTCGGCVRSVTRALESCEGVVEVNEVSVDGQSATVTIDPAVAKREELVEAIEDAGFDVPA